ncbi:glycosyltransferase family 39 protein [Desulfococcaceae bacterium HSG7]|nr:glycosyltransferase family 39 protein [Desulfococcaceae bacterium HSG7]
MSRINVYPESGVVSISPILFDNISINTSTSNIFILTGVIVIGLIFLTSIGRTAVYSCLCNITTASAFILSTCLLIFTLFPTNDGLPIVIYFIFGSAGLIFLIMAMYPFVVWSVKYPFGKRLRCMFDGICHYFFNVEIKFLLIVVFIVTFISTNLISYYIFEHIPHVQDSLVQVFHAKIFSIGKVVVPSHPIKEFFDFSHIINNGKWYSVYPPGHSFLIMLGFFVGMPWVVNPLLGSLSILIFYFIGKELYDEKTGRIALLLGLFSPFIMFMSSEFMSHSSALFFLSLFILFFAKTTKQVSLFYPLFAGGSLGMALLARPVTALAVSVPFAIYALFNLIKYFKNYVLRLFIMLAACLVFIGILLTFNYLTNSDPLLFGYEVKWGPEHNLGFGNGIWGEIHTPQKGLQQNLNNLNALNRYLFEWPIPCLLFMFIPFAAVSRNIWDYILISSFFALSLIYFFFWYQDWCFGPRYMYEASIMAIILTSRGILLTCVLINDVFRLKITPEIVKRTVGSIVAACILTGMIFNVPPLIKYYAHTYWRVNASALQTVKKAGVKNAVVFVRSYYGSVLPENSPLLDDDIIFVKHLGKKNRLMMEYYPERRYYLVNNYSIIEIFSPKKRKLPPKSNL